MVSKHDNCLITAGNSMKHMGHHQQQSPCMQQAEGLPLSRTSGKAVRGGWCCQDENTWATRLSEMVTTCHKMASESTWWPCACCVRGLPALRPF